MASSLASVWKYQKHKASAHLIHRNTGKSTYEKLKRDFLGAAGQLRRPPLCSALHGYSYSSFPSPLVAFLFSPRKREKREKEKAREDLREEKWRSQLLCLFSPQHGFYCEVATCKGTLEDRSERRRECDGLFFHTEVLRHVFTANQSHTAEPGAQFTDQTEAPSSTWGSLKATTRIHQGQVCHP